MMILKNIKLIFALNFIFINFAYSQSLDSSKVRILGQVFDPFNQASTFNVMIVNLNVGRGEIGNLDGSFSMVLSKKDTLLISTKGYKLVKLSFADSVYRNVYNIKIPLNTLHYELRSVTIFAPRDLEKIQADIEKLGFTKQDYMLSGINALMSPITFLYQSLSRYEKQKRLAYQLMNDYKRKELLKELFVQYVDHDIIDLQTDKFDDFIDFIDVTDNFLKNISQYDFIMFVKARYKIYKVKFSEDYYYDKN